MTTRASQKAYDRRAFLRRLGQGAAVMLLGLAGTTGAVSMASAKEPKVRCMSLSREEYEKLLSEGKLPQTKCKCDCC